MGLDLMYFTGETRTEGLGGEPRPAKGVVHVGLIGQLRYEQRQRTACGDHAGVDSVPAAEGMISQQRGADR